MHINIVFVLHGIEMSLPRSPYHFGHEYTVSQYREYLNSDGADRDLSFHNFRLQMWKDAASKPELSRYFKQAEELDSIN